jgi:hypothetical protein
MQISDDTLAVVNYLNDFTSGNLRKKNDIEVIIEICASYNGAETLNRLIFASKSVWNISTKLRKVNPSADGIELLRKELERGCSEMTNYLKDIISLADKDLNDRFNDIYFLSTRGTIKNLIDLAHDLSQLKDLQQRARQNK